MAGGGAIKPSALAALEQELQRGMKELGGKGKPPPYYIAYEIHDRNDVTVAASYGALVQSSVRRSRILDTDVRVGDYKLDSTHTIRSNDFDFSSVTTGHPVALPLSDDATALRAVAWRETDRRYNEAAERLVKIRTQRTLKVADDDPSDDFSREKPASYLGAPAALAIDVPAWEQSIRQLSARFRGQADILDSGVTLQASSLTRWLVNSEGTIVQTGRNYVRVFLEANARADDGMELERFETFDAATLDGLGGSAEMEKAADAIIADLRALRKAPLADPYIGPAILEGRAAGVFFHEIFGHRVEGHRQKNEEEGQTFAKKVGRADHAGVRLGVRRSHAVAAGRRRPQRLLPLRRRGRGGAARDAGVGRRAEGLPAQPIADARFRAVERPRAAAGGAGGRVAPGKPGRRTEADRLGEPSCAICCAPRRSGKGSFTGCRSATSRAVSPTPSAAARRRSRSCRSSSIASGSTAVPTSWCAGSTWSARRWRRCRASSRRRTTTRRSTATAAPSRASSPCRPAAPACWSSRLRSSGATRGTTSRRCCRRPLSCGRRHRPRHRWRRDRATLAGRERLLVVLVVLAGATGAAADSLAKPADATPAVRVNAVTVKQAMEDELARSMKELRMGDDEPHPYYIAYTVSDVDQATTSATLGAVTAAHAYRGRLLRTEVRVGDANFDNTNFEGGASVEAIPIEDDYAALRRELWLRSDEAYKSAVETLARKRSAASGQASADEDDGIADFSPQAAAHVEVPFSSGAPDPEALRETVRKLSLLLASFPGDLRIARHRNGRRRPPPPGDQRGDVGRRQPAHGPHRRHRRHAG